MPTNKKKKGGKGKGATARSNAANKDDLAGLDDILGCGSIDLSTFQSMYSELELYFIV